MYIAFSSNWLQLAAWEHEHEALKSFICAWMYLNVSWSFMVGCHYPQASCGAVWWTDNNRNKVRKLLTTNWVSLSLDALFIKSSVECYSQKTVSHLDMEIRADNNWIWQDLGNTEHGNNIKGVDFIEGSAVWCDIFSGTIMNSCRIFYWEA